MEDFLTKLSKQTVLQISGVDTRKYLHGQVSVELENWQSNTARFAAHCDFKGKMWNSFLICDQGENMLISGHHEANTVSLEQLKKYGVFSKVEIREAEEYSIFVGAGKDVEKLVEDMFASAPQSYMSTVQNDFGVAIRMDFEYTTYKLILNADGVKYVEQNAATLIDEQLGEQYVEYLEIGAGIGNIQAKTVGEFVPQMLNLQYLNAIDFDKGCYMGQEVVARTKFLGKNKRATYILNANEAVSKLNIGDPVEIQVGENWRRAGKIIRFANVNGKTRALAVLPNDTEYGTVLKLKDSTERFTVSEHPYPFEIVKQ
ncbi:CAF17-like 4Fe-4S cluster assembly/insertion protein YgfZ [Agaribacter flavus]|uniref:YgfZ/GcvT domain-containing protein n=1 Tax=Agaribacter flavus TaxID=1902781 RepID=A0ABV7FUG5_9ALTE